MTRLRVGDRVESRLNRSHGTVEYVHPNGCVDVVGDFGRVNRLFPELFILIGRAPDMPSKFQPGDKVRHIGSNHSGIEVWGVSPDGIHLWLKYGSVTPYCGIAAVYEKVPDFFEAGKVYVYSTARFKVKYIETNDDGVKVAIGRLSWGGDAYYWDVRNSFNGWTEE